MKRSLKKAAVPVLAMITACAMCMTAYAAEDKITKVKVQVNRSAGCWRQCRHTVG